MARNKGLIIALEDADLDQATAGASEAEIPESQLEVEEGVQEVEADVANVEELVTAVEDAEADAETLGEIEGVMEESIEEGEGLDETSAELAEVAVESIRLRLGFAPSRTLPALESFGSKNSRLTATKIALEGVVETIKKVWEAIQKAFFAVWQKIKDFYNKFFTNTEKVKKLAQQLKQKARETKGTAANKTIDASGVAKALNYEGKASLDSVKRLMSNHVAVSKGVLAGKDRLNEAIAVITDGLKKPADFNVEKLVEAGKKFISVVAVETTVTEEGSSSTVVSGPFVGGQSVKMSFKGEGNDTRFSYEVINAEKKAEVAIPVLSTSEAETAADQVIQLMASTDEYKKQQQKIEALNKNMVEVAKTAISAASAIEKATSEEADVTGKVAAMRKAVTSMNSVSSRMITMVPSMNVQLGKAVLKYVDLSLKQYKAEEEKK